MTKNFMYWVACLPEVGDPILLARDDLAALLARADALEAKAAALRAEARAGQGRLLERLDAEWSPELVKRTVEQYGERAEVLRYIVDDDVRQAARALDIVGALEVLRAFNDGRVIRQHNLFSTAPEVDRAATLRRVFDWWNYCAVPYLNRVEFVNAKEPT